MKNVMLQRLIEIAETIGNVNDVHMYNKDFITVEGVNKKGAKFSLTLNMKQEEEKKEEESDA